MVTRKTEVTLFLPDDVTVLWQVIERMGAQKVLQVQMVHDYFSIYDKIWQTLTADSPGMWVL